jgi:hypothetical protein
MKTMKAFCTAIVLSLTISISAFAGDIATPGAARTSDSNTGTISTTPPSLPADTEDGYPYASAFGDVFLTLISMF